MRIYCVTDAAKWCWATSVREIQARLPHHEFVTTNRPRVSEAAKFDLIWQRGYAPIFQGAEKAGVPVVWTFTTGGAMGEYHLKRCRSALTNGSTVICQNAASERLLRASGARHVAMIPNGVDTGRFRPPAAPPSDFVVGMAANINGERWINKGARDLVAACERLGVTLRLATKPRPGVPSKAPAHDIGLVDHDEMHRFLRGLSVYCQPSLAEGCSNSIQEAMACGRPTIICRESGWHGEVCRDFSNTTAGEVLFVEPGDVDGLAAAILFLKRHPDRAARLGRNARRFARKHNWDVCAKRYDEVFQAAADRATAFHLVTVATGRHVDCLEVMLPSWVGYSGAETITVFTDRENPGFPPGVDVRSIAAGTDWISGCLAKANAMVRLARELPTGSRLVFLDADCAVLKPLHAFARGAEDIGLTRLSMDPSTHPKCAGTCSAGAIAVTVNDRSRRFLELWAEVQGAYARNGHGVRPGKVAADQYALTDLARGRACGVTIRAMDEHVWNNAPDLFDEAWIEDIRRHRPAVLHFKGGRWKDSSLLRRAVAAANGEAE